MKRRDGTRDREECWYLSDTHKLLTNTFTYRLSSLLDNLRWQGTGVEGLELGLKLEVPVGQLLQGLGTTTQTTTINQSIRIQGNENYENFMSLQENSKITKRLNKNTNKRRPTRQNIIMSPQKTDFAPVHYLNLLTI